MPPALAEHVLDLTLVQLPPYSPSKRRPQSASAAVQRQAAQPAQPVAAPACPRCRSQGREQAGAWPCQPGVAAGPAAQPPEPVGSGASGSAAAVSGDSGQVPGLEMLLSQLHVHGDWRSLLMRSLQGSMQAASPSDSGGGRPTPAAAHAASAVGAREPSGWQRISRRHACPKRWAVQASATQPPEGQPRCSKPREGSAAAAPRRPAQRSVYETHPAGRGSCEVIRSCLFPCSGHYAAGDAAEPAAHRAPAGSSIRGARARCRGVPRTRSTEACSTGACSCQQACTGNGPSWESGSPSWAARERGWHCGVAWGGGGSRLRRCGSHPGPPAVPPAGSQPLVGSCSRHQGRDGARRQRRQR